MKKMVFLFILLVLIIGQNCNTALAELGYISVTRTESVEIEPNVATINFTVETTDINSTSTTEKNNEISTNLINSLKEVIKNDSKAIVQTKSYTLKPNYINKNDNADKIIKNYTATNTIFVKTSDVASLSNLIDTAIKNKVTKIGDVNFVLDNQEQIQTNLTNTAIEKAQQEARAYATTLKQKVVGVKSLEVNSYQSGNSLRLYSTAKTSTNTTSTPIESGKVKLNSTVNALFYIK